jgi:hypothetical protein
MPCLIPPPPPPPLQNGTVRNAPQRMPRRALSMQDACPPRRAAGCVRLSAAAHLHTHRLAPARPPGSCSERSSSRRLGAMTLRAAPWLRRYTSMPLPSISRLEYDWCAGGGVPWAICDACGCSGRRHLVPLLARRCGSSAVEHSAAACCRSSQDATLLATPCGSLSSSSWAAGCLSPEADDARARPRLRRSRAALAPGLRTPRRLRASLLRARTARAAAVAAAVARTPAPICTTM